ncbi:hypothetical protein ACMDCT_09125 [Halomonadaceae bacterium KBTZ08]
MTRQVIRLSLLLLALVAGKGVAVEFITPQPLVDSVDTAVKSCRQADQLRVPMRTSGMDLVPLYANDYALETPEGSLFARNDLDVKLHLENDIRAQLDAYLSCDVPIMRGSQSMLNAVADITEADARTQMVGIYQHGFSNGADALVTRESIESVTDLSGARIAIQAHGPHLNYLNRILSDAREQVEDDGGEWEEPTLAYTEELVGLYGDTPGAALLEESSVDAAVVTATDGRTLTSGGEVGTGAEGSVKGAEIMLSSRSANRLISEVYVVRADYLKQNREQVRRFVKSLLNAEESVREDVVKQVIEWSSVAEALLEDPGAVEPARQLWRDVETVGLQGNIDWNTPDKRHSWKNLNDSVQSTLVDRGLLNSAYTLGSAEWNYNDFAGGIFDQRRSELPGFDNDKAASVVEEMRSGKGLEENALVEFEIHFEPNQTRFASDDYQDEFDEVLEQAATYGGAVLTVEGHSDPLNYLKKKHNGASAQELKSIRQATRNLSMSRATEVRDALLSYAREQGESMDKSQFVTMGHGIDEPKTGMCDGDPCAPETKAEWKSNMRVVFRVVNVEAEADTFTPANSW